MYEEGTLGRQRIYTDEEYVTLDNVVSILQNSMPYHEMNKVKMSALIDYEKGNQPLVRKKVVREEIDIQSTANLANEITEFKLGYNWGNPISIVQKSSLTNEDNGLISKIANIIKGKQNKKTPMFSFNELFDNQEKDSKDQELARYVEICGVGYQMIKQNNEFDGITPFELVSLNPLFTYVVYSTDITHKPVCAITFTQTVNYVRTFYVWSKDKYFVIRGEYLIDGDKRQEFETYTNQDKSPYANILGEIPIIEYNRSFDLLGCFERQMDEMNALNVMQSDLANDIAQNTQAFWWGNDVEFPEDADGSVTLKGGSLILTKTGGNNNKPTIQAMTSEYDYAGILSNIDHLYNKILEKAYVPRQTEASGGSTGTAMSMTSGWAAAETNACKEALILKKSFKQRNKLALIAIKHIVDTYSSEYDLKDLKNILNLDYSDIDVKFTRQKTFDMATKVNSLATLINTFVDPAEAVKVIDFFPDEAETINSSYENMKKYQELKLESLKPKETQVKSNQNTDTTQQNDNTGNSNRTMQDSSDQNQNSPISSI